MSQIRVGDAIVEVEAERDDRGKTVYAPECCSARYPSMKVVLISHMSGCPRDREIRWLLDGEAQS